MSYRTTILVLSTLLLTSISAAEDPYLWLEKVEGKEALEWVTEQNAITDKSLASDPLYQELYEQAFAVLSRSDKLPNINVKGNWVYNLQKSDDNPRGIYRRTSMEDFVSGKPKWQAVLDVDKLSESEGQKWVFRGMYCLPPAHETCLLSLAPGGSDAHVLREFDPNLGRFVEGGFEVPLAKTRVSWLTEDKVFIGTDFGEGSLTSSGYPRIQKLWLRGTELSQAETVMEVPVESVAASATNLRQEASVITLFNDGLSFWTSQYYQLDDAELVKLQLPNTAQIVGLFDGRFVISLKADWNYEDNVYGAGSVLLAAPQTLQSGKGEIEQVVSQSREFIVEEIRVSDKGIAIVAMEDVKASLYLFTHNGKAWNKQKVALPEQGKISIAGMNADTMIVRYEDFLTPPTLFSVDSKLATSVVMQQPATFDRTNMMVEQFFTESADGTRVPYFVIRDKNLKMDGSNPTHIFSYGGFRNALQPSYSGSYEAHNGVYGKMWLERGGVYVLANIRGGGEYGPQWHAAALQKNRPRSFEDFEAVAEDLFKRKITSANKLSIEGRSQGGYLVGALMTRRPDLYNAVICGVPLLDMKRYNKLLAGASWMAEYGNPDTDDWDFMQEWSPYQNVKKDVDYPAIFFFTSTKDDRVHPGHARKMAAKMKALGQEVEYYENLEGGHVGSSTAKQLAKRVALSYTHLWRQSGAD